MTTRDSRLFSSSYLFDYLEQRKERVKAEVGSYPPDDLLNTPDDNLLDYFSSQSAVQIPAINFEGKFVTHEETTKRRHVEAFFSRSGRPETVDIPAVKCQVHIPFSGPSELLHYQPSSYSSGTGSAPTHTANNEIVIEIVFTNDEAANLESQIEREVGFIERNTQSMESDISKFNNSISDSIKTMIRERKEWLLKSRSVVESLNIPIKLRDDRPTSYPVPVKRKQITITRPKTTGKEFRPEPEISIDTYEQVLTILRDMVTAMERSPRTFSKLKEEEIRDLFLVWLNAIFEGQAAGELFNFEGKTDILIRIENKKVFIAECKNWRGPKNLIDALDQLLGYATWRDTKLALLIFNKRKNLTSVLAKIPIAIREHSSFKKEIFRKEETEFSFIVSHRDDNSRELKLAIMVFEVPE